MVTSWEEREFGWAKRKIEWADEELTSGKGLAGG